MHNFILKSRPLSYNSCCGNKRIRYKEALENAFKDFNSSGTFYSGEIYATLYYFFNKDLYLDTDNLSKPIWDCLCGFLYNDDQQIKIRTAGSFNLSEGDFNVIDFSNLQGDLVIELIEAFEKEDHIVYIKCGNYNPSMYQFNLE